MKNSTLKNLLREMDIKRYIDQNLSKADIVHMVQETFKANAWKVEKITSYIIEKFIQEEFNLMINPNKKYRKATYWVTNDKPKSEKTTQQAPGQLSLDTLNTQPPSPEETDNLTDIDDVINTAEPQTPIPSKEIDLQSKTITDIPKSQLAENTITLESISNDIATLFKIYGKLKSEIKTIQKVIKTKSKKSNKT